MNKSIGFIGCGNMAQAIIGGIVNSQLIPPQRIIASNTSIAKLDKASQMYGIKTTTNNKEVAKQADIVILSVKPNKYSLVIEEIKNEIKKDAIIVGIAAGISIKYIEDKFDSEVKIIRAMPNISSLVNEGMTVISNNQNITNEDMGLITSIFNSIGQVEYMEDELMDNIPAISGSSPAYVFMFIDSLAKGGVSSGIPEEKAYRMAAQSVIGAAKMILQDSKEIRNLTDMVCSPGGCTLEALDELEKNNFSQIIALAMERCTNKVLKLSNK